MITVIVFFQKFQRPLSTHAFSLRECLYLLRENTLKFRLGDSADRGELRKHGYVLKVIEFTEYAELDKFVDTRYENEAQIRVETLYRTIEIPHYLAHRNQPLPIIHHIKKRGVILVYDNDSFRSGLLDGTPYNTCKTLIYILFRFSTAKNQFISMKFLIQFLKQLLLIHMLCR